jgi:hypothetical protein
MVAEDDTIRFPSSDAGGDGGRVEREEIGELRVGEAGLAAEELEKWVEGHGKKKSRKSEGLKV